MRFPEFSGEWEKCQLGDITVNFSRRNKEGIDYPMFSVTNDRGFIPQSEQFEDREMIGTDIKAYKIIHNGEFAYNPARINVGSIAKYYGVEDCMISSLYVCFDVDRKRINSEWFFHLLKTSKMNFYYNLNGEGGVRIYLFYPNFARIKSSYPTKAEQQKIADLFNLLTKRIETQIRVIEDLQTLKKAIIERSYNAGGKVHKIGELIEQVSKRNKSNDYPVLSVNNRLGFIEQADQFEDRTVASDDTSNYKVVSTNDFAYNPARINVGSIARLKDRTNGIVSPMYVCFRTKDKLLPEYMEHFFDTTYFKHEMFKRLEGSVRLCLSYEGLCNISMSIPSIEEQKKLSNRLSAIEQKIQIESKILEAYKMQKSYLLQQMFI